MGTDRNKGGADILVREQDTDKNGVSIPIDEGGSNRD